MKFQFQQYYCEHCEENACKQSGRPDCQYIGKNGCTCVFEQGIIDNEFAKRAIGMANSRRESLIHELITETENIDMYKRIIDESNQTILKMKVIDKLCGDADENQV